jgi:hypothetical protein
MNVETGDIVVIQLSLKFRWTGGSGGDHPRFGIRAQNVSGCSNVDIDDLYYHRTADDLPRNEYQTIMYQYVFTAACNGTYNFIMRMDNNTDADDNSATGDVVIVATRH